MMMYNRNMKTTILRYNVVIRKEGDFYIADVPTLGISDFGKSINEARKNVEGAIEVHLQGLTKIGEEVPRQDTQEEVYFSQVTVTAPKNIKFSF